MLCSLAVPGAKYQQIHMGTRGQVPLPRLTSAHCSPQDGSSVPVLQHPHTAGLVPCVLGTPVPWAWPGCGVRCQQLRSHSYEVLHHILVTLQHFLVALHQILMALHHSQGLSITSPGFPSHRMGLSIILPCLSSLYISRPAPLLFYKCAAPAQPTFQLSCVQIQGPGGLVGLPGHVVTLCSWPLFGWLLPLTQACSLPQVSPPALTNSCGGIHAALYLLASAPSSPALCRSLYFGSHHPMVSHGQTRGLSAFRWVHGLWQWKYVGIV